MSKAIGGREVLDLAIKAEEKGSLLYKTLSKNSRNFHVSQIFKQFAEEEDKYIEEVKKWSKRIIPDRAPEAYPGEYILYIKAMAEDNAFKCDKTCEKFLEADISEEDAMQAGIAFEKDFILFLHNLKRHVKKGEEKVVDSLIERKESRLEKLYTFREKLRK